jgi:adsorption protein B
VTLAAALGAPIAVPVSAALATLMWINAWLLGWRLLMRACFTSAAYGWREGLRSVPRTFIANIIAVLAARRALLLHSAGGANRWDKTHHIFPAEIPRS